MNYLKKNNRQVSTSEASDGFNLKGQFDVESYAQGLAKRRRVTLELSEGDTENSNRRLHGSVSLSL